MIATASAVLGAEIVASLEAGIRVKARVIEAQAETLTAIAELWLAALAEGGKLLLFGNGGSAADAQHIAGELVGRFYLERRALPAISLATDTSILTALANDYGFEQVFARQVEALGRPGDVAVGISTSGRSRNVLAALEAARSLGLATVGFCGEDAGPMLDLSDLCYRVPSRDTPRIQEAHLAAAHAICEALERALFGS